MKKPVPKPPLVSIVTPSLNQGAFIAQAVESVLSQDYDAIEYLVMDGGSTDATLDILRGYGNKLDWVSEPDSGQSAAINTGWRKSRGEVIAWLNADDRLLPGAVSRAVAFLQANPQVSAVYGDCDYIDPRGEVLQRYAARPFDFLEFVRSGENYIPQPATFLRRSLLDSVGYLDERLAYIMDFDYWLRLALTHTIAYLPEPFAQLRIHTAAKSLSSLADFAPELVAVYQRLFASPYLPASVGAVRSQAFANIHTRAAHLSFWSGRTAAARRYALTAWRFGPLRPRLAFIPYLLGRPGLALAKRLRPNPYLLGLADD